MNNVVCFGELLLRLSPELNQKWLRANSMPVYIGGSELNVAAALGRWKIPVSYISSLPANELSSDIIAYLRGQHIDTSEMISGGSRIGCYYLPQGADLKHASVIYDRAHSSFSELRPGVIDWKTILSKASWFHFSAISPALSRHSAEVCLEAAQAAAAHGIPVSIDLNYRSKLWQYGLQPADLMPELVRSCSHVMGNIWAKEKMLGIRVKEGLPVTKAGYLEQARITSREILDRYPKCMQVANTFRFDEESKLHYYATLHTREEMHVSKEYHTSEIKDRVGSGDCFMAGLIFGNLHQMSAQDTVEFATAAAFKKLFITGDATTATPDEIRKLIYA